MDAKRQEWWKDAVRLQGLRSAHAHTGLTGARAAELLKANGPNRFGQDKPESVAWRCLRHLRNPLVLTLLLASAVSAITGGLGNSLIIVGIVLISVGLDVWQELRAGQVIERLRQSVAVRARVLRDGQPQDHPVADLVPGDVVLLSAGDLVPADALVLQARDFFVNQASLTGEAYPVEKHAGQVTPGDDLQDASHAVFMGSSVVSGMAQVLLVDTGARTVMGALAGSLAQAPPPTSFELGMRRFGMLILRMTFLLVLFVLLVNGLMGRPLLESFLFAVALAVGLTPELLPMVVSVTLSQGAMRMARQGMVVKRPAAIQDLGSMDVLCTDKTGTLTEARIQMQQHVGPAGQESERVLELAWLNSHFESGLRSPLDEAILQHRSFDASAWTKIDEVPFDFERRRVSVLLEREGQRELLVKGAPDDILRLCTSGEGAAGPQPLDAAARAQAQATCHALEDQGFRVLAIACRSVPPTQDHAVVHDESALVLVGFAAFLDPPKASAAVALQALQEAGVAVKLVTGDSDRVTRHVCQTLGLPVRGVLTGAEIAQLSDEALGAQVETVNLFCRVNPAQKNRVIQALRARGHVVGYLGDGVNDAPALHSADVGLSVDTAVDVAKATADMILLQPDLRLLQGAVLEGRRTFGNILKYILMGTSSNFGNMFSMAAAVLFLPFLPMLPTQILLNNILYDLSELPIPLDAVDASETATPRVLDMAAIRRFMFTIGPVSSLFDFITFGMLLHVFEASPALFQTGWFVESLCTQVLVIFVIRTRGNPLRSRPHPLLTLTSCLVVGTALCLPWTPVGALFGLQPLPPAFYGVLAVMVLLYLTLVQALKRRVMGAARRPA